MSGSEITHEAIRARLIAMDDKEQALREVHLAERRSLAECCAHLGHLFAGTKWLTMTCSFRNGAATAQPPFLDGYSQWCSVCGFEQWFDGIDS